jgi:hypothetical protein
MGAGRMTAGARGVLVTWAAQRRGGAMGRRT